VGLERWRLAIGRGSLKGLVELGRLWSFGGGCWEILDAKGKRVSYIPVVWVPSVPLVPRLRAPCLLVARLVLHVSRSLTVTLAGNGPIDVPVRKSSLGIR
jgi:hypothetical protein